MNGGIQVDLITANGGVMKEHHDFGLDNNGFTFQEQGSDSWENSIDETDTDGNMFGNDGVRVKVCY